MSVIYGVVSLLVGRERGRGEGQRSGYGGNVRSRGEKKEGLRKRDG